jgi:hypothetical protein
VKKLLIFMEHEGSLPTSQKSAIWLSSANLI